MVFSPIFLHRPSFQAILAVDSNKSLLWSSWMHRSIDNASETLGRTCGGGAKRPTSHGKLYYEKQLVQQRNGVAYRNNWWEFEFNKVQLTVFHNLTLDYKYKPQQFLQIHLWNLKFLLVY